MAEDPRYRQKLYLEAHILNANLTKDDGVTQVVWIVCFANPDYPLTKVFNSKGVDLVFAIPQPTTTPVVGTDRKVYGYDNRVPLEPHTMDKDGITGEKLYWKAVQELRRLAENYPYGSVRSIEEERPNTQRLGSTTLYSGRVMWVYKTGTT